MLVELHCGPWRCGVRPDVGGSLASLEYAHISVLRPSAPQGWTSPRDSAGFALVPYSNRIRDRRFHWQGTAFSLEANFPGSPHSLHGCAWLHAWNVVHRAPAELLLRYGQGPDGHWPFGFSVLHHLKLDTHGLHCALSVTSDDDRPQPMGLGWHPYFPQPQEARLEMQVAGIWQPDTHGIATQRQVHGEIHQTVGSAQWDHCFDGWDGVAQMFYPGYAITLRSNLSRVVVFTPEHRRFFCVEPVSHVSNAINAADPEKLGLQVLHPGATISATMTLTLEMAT